MKLDSLFHLVKNTNETYFHHYLLFLQFLAPSSCTGQSSSSSSQDSGNFRILFFKFVICFNYFTFFLCFHVFCFFMDSFATLLSVWLTTTGFLWRRKKKEVILTYFQKYHIIHIQISFKK